MDYGHYTTFVHDAMFVLYMLGWNVLAWDLWQQLNRLKRKRKERKEWELL